MDDEYEENDIYLYIPVKIPKKKYVLGIDGLYETEAMAIIISIILSIVFSYQYFGDFMRYALFIIGIAAGTGILTFLLVIRTKETNTSTIGYFIKYIKYLRSTKLFMFKYINILKGDKL